MSSENIMRLFNDAVTNGRVRPRLNIIVKTASYTVTSGDFGSVLTTRGASGEVTFTLPAASSVNKNNWALFINIADENMIVAGADEGLVVFNDLTADSIGFATNSEKIAGGFLAISDGTSWLVLPIATETQTVNVFTAASTSPSASPSPSSSPSPSASVSSSPSTSVSGSPSTSPSASPSPSSSPSPSDSPSASPSPSTSPSASPSGSPSDSPSSSSS